MITASLGLIGVLAFEADFSSVWRTPDLRFYELGVAVVVVIAAVAVTILHSRLAAVAALGVVGYGVALIFIMFGAPDLAMTQFAIETLTVVLFVLVIYRLPTFKPLSDTGTRLRDAVIAITAGGIMTTLVLIITSESTFTSRLTPYFADNSYLLAKGHNVVNVILVDFRGFDTMGEITVLSIAAIGVYALLKLNMNARDGGE
jgi:multicomponent Na+:H+ antiporter subunit A